MSDETWLSTLKKRINFVLPATTNPTQHTVFREWLQICDKIEEEQKEQDDRFAALKAAFVTLAPALAVVARDDRHTAEARTAMLSAEKQFLDIFAPPVKS
jgi:hypothetical protein